MNPVPWATDFIQAEGLVNPEPLGLTDFVTGMPLVRASMAEAREVFRATSGVMHERRLRGYAEMAN